MVGISPRIGFVDIEVLQEGTKIPNTEETPRPIICVTIYDSYNKHYTTILQKDGLKHIKKQNSVWEVVTFSNEHSLMRYLLKYLSTKDFDIVTAWNVDFDFDYIVNRAKKLELENEYAIDTMFEDIHTFDMLKAYRRIKNLRNYSLDYVARMEGIIEKTESASSIPWLYENNLKRLVNYNKIDVEIIKELEDKVGVVSMNWQMKSYVGVPSINDCAYFSLLLDTALLRIAKSWGVCLPSKPSKDDESGSFEGAIVFDPKPGIHDCVIGLDMGKFYPSIVLSLNISPEVYTKNMKMKTKEPGIVPEMVKFFIKERKHYENMMEKYTPGAPEYEMLSSKRQVVKDLLNAVWGFVGYRRCRIFRKELAELVARTAREGLTWAKEQAEEKGYTVLYGDSVVGDTIVPISTEGGDHVKLPISDLYDKYVSEGSVGYYKIDDKAYINVSNLDLRTFAIDEYGTIKTSKLRNIMKHKCKKGLYEIKTDTKEITVTEDHSLLIWKDDRLISATPESINTDDCVYVYDNKPNPRKERIRSIERIETKEEHFVYDVVVDDCHTFLANDIFVHNTDSLYIQSPHANLEDIITGGEQIAQEINESFDQFAKEKFGLKEHQFVLEFEKIADPAMFLRDVKKRYACRILYEKGKYTDYIMTRGLEVRRTDTSEITNELQSNILEMLLHRKPNQEIIDYVRNIVKKIKSGETDPRELAISKGIQKKIESYGVQNKGLPIHIRAAMYSNKNFGTNFDKGDKIKYLYVKRVKGYPSTDVIAFTDDMELPEIIVDHERMLDVTVKSKVSILELRGIFWNNIICTNNLFAFT